MPIPKGAYWICNCRHPRTPVYYADEMDRLRAGLQRIGELSASYMPVVARLLRGESIEQIATAAPISSKTDVKHERRVVGHVSGWKEQMDTCVCGKPWPCPELESSKQRICKGCEHMIPWDWVFCAWCGFENDAPEKQPVETTGLNDCTGLVGDRCGVASCRTCFPPLTEADEVQIGRSQAELAVLKKDGRSYEVRRIAGQALEVIIRLKAARSPVEPTPCPECVAVRKIGLLSCHKHIPEKAGCALCAEGMNSFSDPTTGNRMHARNGVVTVCTGPGPMPQWGRLLLECRDALPHITLAAARLAGLDLTLADRIEALLEPWKVAPDDPNGV